MKKRDGRLNETIRIMGRLAAMPHKPHVAKKAAAKKRGRTKARPKAGENA